MAITSSGKMANFLAFVVFSSILVFVCGEEDIAPTLEPNQDCGISCDEKYSLLEPTNGLDIALKFENQNSCKRGCRFYLIKKLINSGSDYGLGCSNDCSRAYESDQENLESCVQGCNFQVKLDASNQIGHERGNEEEEEEGASWHTMTPVLQVRKVMAQVVGSMKVLHSSVLTYFLQDDNTLVAVQSKPQIIMEVSDPENMPQDGTSRENEMNDNLVFSSSLQQDGLMRLPLHDAPRSTVERIPLNDRRQYAYLINLLMLLGAVSLTLLALSYCFAILRHQQRKTKKAANLNVALQHEPLKLVRPEDLTKLSLMEEDDQQAPPLPNKHDLALPNAQV